MGRSALRGLGFETRQGGRREISGEPAAGDVAIPGLAIDTPASQIERPRCGSTLDADLVIFENIASLPLNFKATMESRRSPLN